MLALDVAQAKLALAGGAFAEHMRLGFAATGVCQTKQKTTEFFVFLSSFINIPRKEAKECVQNKHACDEGGKQKLGKPLENGGNKG